MKSDIFDEFAKIAQEKGIISNDSSEAKKKLEQNPRNDSLDISAIEALYGTKAKPPKGMEYEFNIMEIAHPNSVVVSPSYDKLNGLVENEIERQNINMHIVHKTPDGLQTQRKYAEKQLVLSLVRLGNHLDNQGADDLRSLADFCLMQIGEKTLKKTAIGFLAPAVAIAAILGGVYLKNHMKFVSDGLEKDHQKLISEIDDLINSNQSAQTFMGAGQSYKPEFINLMQAFKGKLNEYMTLYMQQVVPVLAQVERPSTAQDLMEQAKNPDTANISEVVNNFKSATANLLPMITKIQSNFASEDYKARQIQEKGKLTSLVDMTGLHGGKGLVADDFDDVSHALETYVLDIQNVAKALAGSQTLEKQVISELSQASTSTKNMFTDQTPSNKGVKDIDKQVGGLDKDLAGLLGFH